MITFPILSETIILAHDTGHPGRALRALDRFKAAGGGAGAAHRAHEFSPGGTVDRFKTGCPETSQPWYPLCFMPLSDVYAGLGEESFGRLIRGISISRLKTYQIYEGFKTRAHLTKLNSEALRKAVPRFWGRILEHDEEFAKELAQAVLVSQLDMIIAVLDFLGVPHENGFFSKDIDPKPYLTEGWENRVFQQFRETYPEALLLFYINHLAWELTNAVEPYQPQK